MKKSLHQKESEHDVDVILHSSYPVNFVLIKSNQLLENSYNDTDILLLND